MTSDQRSTLMRPSTELICWARTKALISSKTQPWSECRSWPRKYTIQHLASILVSLTFYLFDTYCISFNLTLQIEFQISQKSSPRFWLAWNMRMKLELNGHRISRINATRLQSCVNRDKLMVPCANLKKLTEPLMKKIWVSNSESSFHISRFSNLIL